MTNPTSQAYLRDAVMTASPEQLQLMLYDGAIRFASEGREALVAEDWEKAFDKLSRAQKIVLEMERGLNPEVAPELCDRMSALYMFVYRKLVDGCVGHDTKSLDDALEVLRFERETWVMLKEKLAKEQAEASDSAAPTQMMPVSLSGGGGSLSVEG